MPGPAPDPNALRRDRKDDKGTWTHLPAQREGPTPEWPFGDAASGRELKQWEREWKRPQAVMWERDHQEEEVALYVQTLFRAQGALADAPTLNALMRMQNNLGLSQPGLMRLRWRIDTDTAEAPVRTNDADRRSAKSRFRTLAGGRTA